MVSIGFNSLSLLKSMVIDSKFSKALHFSMFHCLLFRIQQIYFFKSLSDFHSCLCRTCITVCQCKQISFLFFEWYFACFFQAKISYMLLISLFYFGLNNKTIKKNFPQIIWCYSALVTFAKVIKKVSCLPLLFIFIFMNQIVCLLSTEIFLSQ